MSYEKDYNAWLQYPRCEYGELRNHYLRRCRMICAAGDSPAVRTAADELAAGIAAMVGREPDRVGPPAAGVEPDGCVFVGTLDELSAIGPLPTADSPGADGYAIRTIARDGATRIVIAGQNDRGALYGAFRFLNLLQTGERLDGLDLADSPRNLLRMMNHWDNPDGTIERGYAGNSVFFRDGRVVSELGRVRDYARLMASIGINAVALNNVNVHGRAVQLIAGDLDDAARVADLFRQYGIRLFLSISFAAPTEIGGLDTADPLDGRVRAWWRDRAADIYARIPDFGGFLVKADSEFRPGPFTYGRNHADGANMLAEALAPHGGIVIWRCFVYNCLQDWRDRSTDRARAAYDHFVPLDGAFADNVILQIKNGPMDFQVREPVSPLFGGLSRTNQMLELQITQEYTGQQKHVCYLVPQWKEALDFDTYAAGAGSTVAETVSGRTFGRPLGGFAGVSNIGDDDTWTGHPLAQANLFGFGRLAWNPALSAEQIAREWTRLTYGPDPLVSDVVCGILMASWHTYENYTAPLGVGWMVKPGHHFGPDVDGYEYSKWGTYHFADRNGIGVDRTRKSGTGYTAQYHPAQGEIYESPETCPDELLLFFHHVPYTHRLKSGKTVIQHIYDSHFLGAEQAETFVGQWRALQGRMAEERYRRVLERLEFQAEHAKEWRDVINTYFYRKSGIPDERGRHIYP